MIKEEGKKQPKKPNPKPKNADKKQPIEKTHRGQNNTGSVIVQHANVFQSLGFVN